MSRWRTRSRGPGTASGPARDGRALRPTAVRPRASAADGRAAAAPADRPYWAAREAGRLETLAAAAAAVQHASDEQELLDAVGAAVEFLGLSAHLALLDPVERVLVVRKAVLPWVPQVEAERLRGGPLVGQRIELDAAPAHAVLVREERLVHAPKALSWVFDVPSGTPPAEAEAVAAFLGIGEALLAPITDGRRVFGALTVWAPALSVADRSAATLLGRLAGGALAAQGQRAAG